MYPTIIWDEDDGDNYGEDEDNCDDEYNDDLLIDDDWELGPLSVPNPPPLKLSSAPNPRHFNSSTITASM